MEELGSTGTYYYDFTTSETGKFYATMNARSKARKRTFEFELKDGN